MDLIQALAACLNSGERQNENHQTAGSCGVGFPLLASAVDGVELLKKVDRNLEPESYESYRKLINIEPNGAKKEFVIYSVKKGKDQVATLFLWLSSDKDAARCVRATTCGCTSPTSANRCASPACNR